MKGTNKINYTADDAIRIANRESRRKTYFNRLYLTQDISTILTCYKEGTLKYVRFPDVDPNTGQTFDVKTPIIRDIGGWCSQCTPNIILISYRNVVLDNGHATVLAVDLDRYQVSQTKKDSIMCFDSAHAFYKKLGLSNKKLNKTHFDQKLQDSISDKPLNNTRM